MGQEENCCWSSVQALNERNKTKLLTVVAKSEGKINKRDIMTNKHLSADETPEFLCFYSKNVLLLSCQIYVFIHLSVKCFHASTQFLSFWTLSFPSVVPSLFRFNWIFRRDRWEENKNNAAAFWSKSINVSLGSPAVGALNYGLICELGRWKSHLLPWKSVSLFSATVVSVAGDTE